jgi:hypothetical protein
VFPRVLRMFSLHHVIFHIISRPSPVLLKQSWGHDYLPKARQHGHPLHQPHGTICGREFTSFRLESSQGSVDEPNIRIGGKCHKHMVLSMLCWSYPGPLKETCALMPNISCLNSFSSLESKHWNHRVQHGTLRSQPA